MISPRNGDSKPTPVLQDLSRFKLPKRFRGRPAWVVQIWWIVQATAFAWSPQFAYCWRSFILRFFGAHIGRHVRIRASATITYPWNVTIGDYAWIGDGVVLYSLGKIDIGAHTVVSQRSYLCAASHDYTTVEFDIFASALRIGDQAWVAADVFVGPGVTIGGGTVVGARSSVFCDLPGGVIAFGQPARVIRSRISKGDS